MIPGLYLSRNKKNKKIHTKLFSLYDSYPQLMLSHLHLQQIPHHWPRGQESLGCASRTCRTARVPNNEHQNHKYRLPSSATELLPIEIMINWTVFRHFLFNKFFQFLPLLFKINTTRKTSQYESRQIIHRNA